MDETTKFEMMEAMRRYGGSFVQALAECFARADATNFAKLYLAFPDYVDQYIDMARRDSEREKTVR